MSATETVQYIVIKQCSTEDHHSKNLHVYYKMYIIVFLFELEYNPLFYRNHAENNVRLYNNHNPTVTNWPPNGIHKTKVWKSLFSTNI